MKRDAASTEQFGFAPKKDEKEKKTKKDQTIPQAGLEPATFGLEVQRAIHCATGAYSGVAKPWTRPRQLEPAVVRTPPRTLANGASPGPKRATNIAHGFSL